MRWSWCLLALASPYHRTDRRWRASYFIVASSSCILECRIDSGSLGMSSLEPSVKGSSPSGPKPTAAIGASGIVGIIRVVEL